MQLESQGKYLLFVSANGMGKRTETEEFNTQYRGGRGVRCYKVTKRTGEVISVKAVNEDNEVMLITTEGIIIRILVSDISVIGSNTSGVKLMNVDDNVTVASVAKVREESSTKSEEDVIKNLEKELDEDIEDSNEKELDEDIEDSSSEDNSLS